MCMKLGPFGTPFTGASWLVEIKTLNDKKIVS